jgi:hypothetical protein
LPGGKGPACLASSSATKKKSFYNISAEFLAQKDDLHSGKTTLQPKGRLPGRLSEREMSEKYKQVEFFILIILLKLFFIFKTLILLILGA